MKILKILIQLMGALLLVGFGFLAGSIVRDRATAPGREFALLQEAHELLVDHYFGELPEDIELQRGMVHGMVSSVGDPFTRYVEPISNELQTDSLSGEYGGIGAYITRDETGAVHLIAFEDSPAEAAGIEESDQLIVIDGSEINAQVSIEEIQSLIRGPVGTIVKLTFGAREPGEEDFIVEIERQSFAIPSVTGYMWSDEYGIGVIAISRFSEKTLEEVQVTYDQMLEEGLGGLILDLRGNSGGLLDASIEVARFFLEEGLVLIDRQRGGSEQRYEVREPGEASKIPMVVLVDGGTASAGEVVAGAFQAQGRAVLVGKETYGKGSVQAIFPLSDGSSLHVTMSRWYTPGGITLDEGGILPDIGIEDESEGVDEILEAGAKVLIERMRDDT